MSERERQIAAALEREEYLRELDGKSIDELSAAYTAAWKKVDKAKSDVGPLLHALIARAVRAIEPDATAIRIDEGDSAHGWVYAGENEALTDDALLSSLLDDLGEFLPSEDHAAHDYDLARAL